MFKKHVLKTCKTNFKEIFSKLGKPKYDIETVVISDEEPVFDGNSSTSCVNQGDVSIVNTSALSNSANNTAHSSVSHTNLNPHSPPMQVPVVSVTNDTNGIQSCQNNNSQKATAHDNVIGYPPQHIPVVNTGNYASDQPFQRRRDNTPPIESQNNVSDDDGFIEHIRRRTVHYFVGGFKPSITENMVSQYVSKKGPKVTQVIVFRNYRYGTATVKLNVENDKNAVLLEDPYFWAEGLICKPWVTHRRLRSNGPSQTDNNNLSDFVKPKTGRYKRWSRSNGSYGKQDYGHNINYQRSDINDYNPYLYPHTSY